MSEYIEREATYEDFEKCNSENPKWTPSRVKTLIARQKAADVAPVRHGRWEYYDTYVDGITVFRCTCCGDLQNGRNDWGWKKNYCPNCGTKMDGGNDD